MQESMHTVIPNLQPLIFFNIGHIRTKKLSNVATRVHLFCASGSSTSFCSPRLGSEPGFFFLSFFSLTWLLSYCCSPLHKLVIFYHLLKKWHLSYMDNIDNINQYFYQNNSKNIGHIRTKKLCNVVTRVHLFCASGSSTGFFSPRLGSEPGFFFLSFFLSLDCWATACYILSFIEKMTLILHY